jgi:hypothetical protein
MTLSAEKRLMLSNIMMRAPLSTVRRSLLTFLSAFLFAATFLHALAPSHFVGTVTAISGNTLSVKTDGDGVRQVEVPSTAAIKRISPGQKDLSNADTLQFGDLDIGDRVLVKLAPASSGSPDVAVQIVAVKQADLVKKQQAEREDWQERGVAGLVKSVDSASGVIVLSSGTGATAKTITVQTTKATVLKRYAPNSVRFDEANTAAIDAIHPGDQLRARGEKNEAGTEIAAEEVISGTFRNLSGTIASVDTAASTLVLKDLATKKLVTVHITADAQMRKLSEHVAQALAARLNGAANGAGGKGVKSPSQSAAPSTPPHGVAGPGGDPQQMLNHAEAIQLASLKKGDAIMVVSTDGTTEVTAITLLAGVEPMLQSPAATQSLLNNWSMGSGGQEVAPE